jgi:GT2 family glycosyltransferase
MVAFMDQHPEVAALGPQLLNADGSLQPSCSYFPSLVGLLIESVGLNRLFPRCSLFARWLMTDWAHDRSRAVDQPSGACLLLRRSSLDRVGVLDERFFVYLEEVDLCYRLARSGATIIYLPSAQVIHYGGQSSIQNLDVRVVARYRSLLLYFQKHFPRWYVALVRLIIAFQMVLRITTLPLLRKRLSVASTGLRPGELAPYYLQVLRLSIAPSDRT